jgi:uncharacterized protein
MIASQNGYLEVVRALLAARADVNAKSARGATDAMIEGGTALMNGSQNGYLEVVRALLAANADVNAKRKDGATAPRR